MAELALDPYPLNQWYGYAPDGQLAMLDPANRTLLQADQPHRWLTQDQRLQSGFDFLAQHGPDVHLTLAYGRHVFAHDLGPEGLLEDLVDSHDAYFYEQIGHARNVSNQRLGEIALGLRQAKSSFTRRLAEVVHAASVPYGSFDIEDSNHPLDAWLFDRLIPIIHPERDEYAFTENETGAAMLALQGIREWYKVGKFGYELQVLEAEHGIRAENPLATVGSAHQDMSRKLRLFGVDVAEMYLDPIAEGMGPSDASLAPVLATGRITYAVAPDYARTVKRGLREEQLRRMTYEPRPGLFPPLYVAAGQLG